MMPLTTEKAVKLIEAENTLIFVVDKRLTKEKIKKEIEELFNVKVKRINVHVRENKKYAYVRLDEKNPAIDLATRLGLI
jgi:large subunit ribosomal protein L23